MSSTANASTTTSSNSSSTSSPSPRAASPRADVTPAAPSTADLSDTTAGDTKTTTTPTAAVERVSQAPIDVEEAIKMFKARAGIELKPARSSETSIIFSWGVRFAYLVNGEQQLGWKCLASQSCREEASFCRLFSGKTSSATKHLKEVHSIPSAPARPPLTEAQEALTRTQLEIQWRPHVLRDDSDDWVQELNLTSAARFAPSGTPMTHKPRILILDGSMRERNYSRLLAYECARVLDYLGAQVRVFSPLGLLVCDPSAPKTDAKVLELSALTEWSEGQMWIATEMHSQVSAAMKNQLDWFPATTGAERPMQGKTVAVLQVTDEDTKSVNAINALQLLAHSMHMPCCTSTMCVPSVSREFDMNGRLRASEHRDRVVDIVEEFFKFTLVFREHARFFRDRYSGRKRKSEASRHEATSESEERRAFIKESRP